MLARGFELGGNGWGKGRGRRWRCGTLFGCFILAAAAAAADAAAARVATVSALSPVQKLLGAHGLLVTRPSFHLGVSLATTRPRTWVDAASPGVCGTLLTGDEAADCRARCLADGGYDAAVCFVSVEEGVAANCALPWEFDKGRVLLETAAADLASCQRACIEAGSSCSAFEFHGDSRRCYLRRRSEIYDIIHRSGAGSGAADGPACADASLRCNKLFERSCPTCFGRRVCMRRNEKVFFAARVCVAQKLKDRHRCIAPGYPWPATQFAVVGTGATGAFSNVTRTAWECAGLLYENPEHFVPDGCAYLAVNRGAPSAAADRWGGPVAASSSCAVSSVGRARDAANGAGSEQSALALADCHARCAASADCVWFEWHRAAHPPLLARPLAGRCVLRDGPGFERSRERATAAADVIAGPPLCVGARFDRQPALAAQAKADPSKFVAPLEKNMRRVADRNLCDGLVVRARHAAPGTAAACRASCLSRSVYDGEKCREIFADTQSGLSCASHARGNNALFARREYVRSLAECSDLCAASADADCAIWEVQQPAAGRLATCYLKTHAHVFAETRTSRRPAASPAERQRLACYGSPTQLVPDEGAFRGVRGCGVDPGANPTLVCAVPNLPVPVHAAAVSRAEGKAGAECGREAVADAAARVDERCEMPGELWVGRDAGAAGAAGGRSGFLRTRFPADGCVQNWAYGALARPAAAGVTPGGCQDACRADPDCVFWTWQGGEGKMDNEGADEKEANGPQKETGDCYTRTLAALRAAVASAAGCSRPDDSVPLVSGGCVYEHWSLISGTPLCKGRRTPGDVEDLRPTDAVTAATATATAPPAAALTVLETTPLETATSESFTPKTATLKTTSPATTMMENAAIPGTTVTAVTSMMRTLTTPPAPPPEFWTTESDVVNGTISSAATAAAASNYTKVPSVATTSPSAEQSTLSDFYATDEESLNISSPKESAAGASSGSGNTADVASENGIALDEGSGYQPGEAGGAAGDSGSGSSAFLTETATDPAFEPTSQAAEAVDEEADHAGGIGPESSGGAASSADSGAGSGAGSGAVPGGTSGAVSDDSARPGNSSLLPDSAAPDAGADAAGAAGGGGKTGVIAGAAGGGAALLALSGLGYGLSRHNAAPSPSPTFIFDEEAADSDDDIDDDDAIARNSPRDGGWRN